MAPAPVRSADAPVLSIRSLCKTYGSGETAVHALREVDLDVRSGEFIVLLGASGSGKSTLLNILGGLDRPTSGEVRFFDQPPHRCFRRRPHALPARACRLRLPVLQPHPQPDGARERRAGHGHRERSMPVDEALELVALSPRRDHFPRSCPAASSSASPSRARS